ncbi:hypothetical protein [Lederbergia lenta]|uniref:Uncharacterized protein ykzS n=1 Tax=Lederbergia lenta TaxID=1467 RepID=A0A2X4WSI4_LEDLE|nr:hypothetical protein [Lederbergia lenta]MCM3110325.1 hypothetical protein [Lederbergia lenta]MEC2324107.1 hypothetical protein [Lederbergia lenta]SQI60590.1 Uncharacterized protein ykzS [Lederbergia lenta]
MELEEAKEIIEQLRSKVIQQVEIKKEDFLTFRQVLIEQEDYKNFHGIAKHGGNIIYEYLDAPRV